MTEIRVWFFDTYVDEKFERWLCDEIEEPHNMDQLHEHYTKTPITFDTEDNELAPCENEEEICTKVYERICDEPFSIERDQWAEENMDYPRESIMFLDIIQIGDEFYYPKKEGYENIPIE